jgi:hypothetical protein
MSILRETRMEPDVQWVEWNAIQRRVLRLALKKEFAHAIDEINCYLARAPAELRCDAIAFRGLVKEKKRDLPGARLDFAEAQSLSLPGSYKRYTIELTLGRLSKEMQDDQQAIEWYYRAIETAIADPTTSGDAALEAFLSLRPASSWIAREREACEIAVRQAWKLFFLSGEPDLQKLQATLAILREAAGRPLPQH